MQWLGMHSCVVDLTPALYHFGRSVTLGDTRMLVYMAPRSYSALGNTRMFNKFTEVSPTFQLFIHTTKITKFGSQQHECRNRPVPPPPPISHPQDFNACSTDCHVAVYITFGHPKMELLPTLMIYLSYRMLYRSVLLCCKTLSV